jgi:AraC-like DNA-binding protein
MEMLIRSSAETPADSYDIHLDALSEVLRDLRLSGAEYCASEFTAPWGFTYPPREGAALHFVADGSCWLRGACPERSADEPPVRDELMPREELMPHAEPMHPLCELPMLLEPGDLVLLPHGCGHVLSDQPEGPSEEIGAVKHVPIGRDAYSLCAGGPEDLGSVAASGCGAPTVTVSQSRAFLVNCAVRFEEPAANPLIELMPHVLLVRRGGCEDPALIGLLSAMADEARSPRIGSATVMTRLADIVITRVIRSWVERRTEDTVGWLAAIRDPQIGRALVGIHRQPEQNWSVTSLAAAAQMSRSIFSERFTTMMGMPPARYVARWRMHLASAWLRRQRLGVAEVAARLGYESEPSFSRAFKRHVGVSPGLLRRGNGNGSGANGSAANGIGTSMPVNL